jgi:hypothetical protein
MIFLFPLFFKLCIVDPLMMAIVWLDSTRLAPAGPLEQNSASTLARPFSQMTTSQSGAIWGSISCLSVLKRQFPSQDNIGKREKYSVRWRVAVLNVFLYS